MQRVEAVSKCFQCISQKADALDLSVGANQKAGALDVAEWWELAYFRRSCLPC